MRRAGERHGADVFRMDVIVLEERLGEHACAAEEAFDIVGGDRDFVSIALEVDVPNAKSRFWSKKN